MLSPESVSGYEYFVRFFMRQSVDFLRLLHVYFFLYAGDVHRVQFIIPDARKSLNEKLNISQRPMVNDVDHFIDIRIHI